MINIIKDRIRIERIEIKNRMKNKNKRQNEIRMKK